MARLAAVMRGFGIALSRMAGVNAAKARVNTTFQGECFKCDMVGHMARDCRAQPISPSTGWASGGQDSKYQKCGSGGHTADRCWISRDCPSNSGGGWASAANSSGGWAIGGQVLKCRTCGSGGHTADRCRISKGYPSNSGGGWANTANSSGGWTRGGQKLTCRKCGNRGHMVDQCRTDMMKICQYCTKKGHLLHECRSRPDNIFPDSKNSLTPPNQGAEWS